ncbi:MAG: carbonic anhydrase, partial [Caulobacteraceae bacterium]
MLEQILDHNKKFVDERKTAGKDKPISGHAHKDIMVFACMDTRLVDLLEPAMGFRRGDIKILKNAGNVIREGCSEIIRCIT